jgi:asparagine synthase (glutamine-hydrolysing)
VARAALGQPSTSELPAALDALEARLLRSVELRMVADVPVGAFLSGGVDSSMVVALMQRASPRPVRTFTIGFNDEAFDEAPFAKRVAAHLGTDHTEVYVSGGDELFAGYERYIRGETLARAAARTPRFLRRGAAATLRAARPETIEKAMRAVELAIPRRLRFAHPGEKLHKLAAVLGEEDPRALYLSLVSWWRAGVPLACSSDVESPHVMLARADRDLPLAQWMMLVDQCTYLPDDILAKVDRASMAVSLETRVPFLDHDLVSYVWSVPLSLKQRNGRGKFLLRELLCRYVPREFVERPKRGFAVPLAEWLRGPLREWAAGLLDESRLRREGFLDPAPIAARWRDHLAGRANAQDELWGVLTFQAWLESTRAR